MNIMQIQLRTILIEIQNKNIDQELNKITELLPLIKVKRATGKPGLNSVVQMERKTKAEVSGL